MVLSRYSGLSLLSTLFSFTNLSAFDLPDTSKPVIRAVRIEGNIKLTGKLDDPRWKLAQPVEANIEIQPAENTPAAQRTTVRVLYNSDYIYFGYDCNDTNPSAIRANITDRDKIYDDDFAALILDTYGDFQRAYEFLVNPYGIQADLLKTTNNEDDSFDTVWESAGVIDGSGYTVEMAIPFKSIRFPSRQEQKWTVILGRVYPRASRALYSWTPIDRNNPCFICQGGVLEGISGVQSVASVDLLPYVVGQQSGALDDDSDPKSSFRNGKLKGRVGIGLRYAPTPDFAVEGVVNPDFSQVESDATQISVNSTFALFYNEKRPFFLLGADMFQNNTQTFYSRTINNPIGAARVIGKSGSLSFSYLAASDRNTPYIVPGEESSDFVSTNLESFSNIARARYDFGGESFLGGMVTTRNTATAHNYVGGIDWDYRFWENYKFRGELFYSDTKEVNDLNIFSDTRAYGSTGHNAAFDGEQYSGTAAQVTLRRDAREWSYGVTYMDRGPTFEAQDGFVPSNNIRTAVLDQQYTMYPNDAIFDQWGVFANEGLHFNYDGTRKELWFVPGVYAQMKSQTNINFNYFAVNNELFKGVQFDNINRVQININSRPLSALALFFSGSFGRFIKRNDTPEMGKGSNIDFTARVRPTSQLQVDLSCSWARLSSVATGDPFYDGYIARVMGVYQFTTELFLRVIGQYDKFNKVVDFYPLFSYKLNAYTIFYAGSTSSLTDFGDPYGFRQTSRQYFLKLQYLFRS